MQVFALWWKVKTFSICVFEITPANLLYEQIPSICASELSNHRNLSQELLFFFLFWETLRQQENKTDYMWKFCCLEKEFADLGRFSLFLFT